MPTTSIAYHLTINGDVPLFNTPDKAAKSAFDPTFHQYYMREYHHIKENNHTNNQRVYSFEKSIELSLIAMINVEETQVKQQVNGHYILNSKLSCLAMVGFPQLKQFLDELQQNKNTWSLSSVQISPHNNYPMREIGGHNCSPPVVNSPPRNSFTN